MYYKSLDLRHHIEISLFFVYSLLVIGVYFYCEISLIFFLEVIHLYFYVTNFR